MRDDRPSEMSHRAQPGVMFFLSSGLAEMCFFCSFVFNILVFQQCHDEYAEECKTEYSQECWDEPRQACHTESTQVTELGKYLCSCLLCIFTRSVQQSILKSAELNMNRFNRTWSGCFFLNFPVSGLPHRVQREMLGRA